MISSASPVTFPVNWAKIVDFARNTVFKRQMAENVFKNPVSTFYYFIF